MHTRRCVDELACSLSREDLEELGIRKLGHEKKLLLVAKCLKEILANKQEKSQDCKKPVPRLIIKKPLPPPGNSSSVSKPPPKELGCSSSH